MHRRTFLTRLGAAAAAVPLLSQLRAGERSPASASPLPPTRQVEELCQKYPVDGFWFDIYHVADRCHCAHCTARMKQEGVNLTVRVPERVTKVRTIPAGETLPFTHDAGVLTVAVPTFTMHTGVVLEY